MEVENLSLCIPRIEINDKRHIENILNKVSFGDLKRIDIVLNNSNKMNDALRGTYRVFIHFNYWHNTKKNKIIQQRLLDDLLVAIVYNKPRYWRIKLAY